MSNVESKDWKLGDEIVCRDDKGNALGSLKLNTKYRIQHVSQNGNVVVNGVSGAWKPSRFEHLGNPLEVPTPASTQVGGTGMKFDGDKPRVELLTQGCPNALLEIAKVLTFGSKKYADHNWQKVPDGQRRYNAAALRHDLAHNLGEVNDPESGLNHLAHKACCVLFELELELRNAKGNQ